jgi:hypothetical protein
MSGNFYSLRVYSDRRSPMWAYHVYKNGSWFSNALSVRHAQEIVGWDGGPAVIPVLIREATWTNKHQGR